MEKTHLNLGWEFVETAREGRSEWLPATVPGHVHLDLMDAGVIGDPFYRRNEDGLRWVDDADWSYRLRFEWEPKEGLDRRVLRFEGLDTVCTVRLNGEEIARHDNMHVPLEVDVTERLRPGENELRVDFQSARLVGERRKAEYAEREGLQKHVERFAERSFVRKSQCMFGWDWGPRLISCGIWKPVSLLEYASRVTDVWVRPSPMDDGSWAVEIQTETEGDGVPLHTLCDEDGATVGTLEGDGTIVVHDPRLWWTHDLGHPHLYTLTTFLEKDGVLLDVAERRIGLRTVRLIREPDDHGESFRFELNGVSLWARGANWIPEDSFPSRLDARRYRHQVDNAVLMGMNMLRVWGGGLYEDDAFYDACDEAGILVWQDFAYACAYYPDTDEYAEAARVEAEAVVKRLRNRASLAHWCGNNENLIMWQAWGHADQKPHRYFGERIYDEVIPAVLERLDPDRSYTPSSPWGGEEHCNEDPVGDVHDWSIWHGSADWRGYAKSRARFVSEFGFASSMSLDLWRTCAEGRDWRPDSPVVRWHDKTGKDWPTFKGFVELFYPASKTLEDWVYHTQLNQRDALRFGIEHWRRSRFCKGTLIWQLNDCWPVQSWALVDSGWNWKAAAHEVRRLYDDVLVSIERDGEKVRVHVVNDSADTAVQDGALELLAVDLLDGRVVREWSEIVSVDSGDRVVAIEADVSGLPASRTLLYASLDEVHDAWQLLANPKDCQFAKPRLRFRIDEEGMGQLWTDRPVVDLMIYDPEGGSPLFDNFVTLPSAATTQLSLKQGAKVGRLRGRSLAGDQEIEVVRGPF